MKLAGPEQLMAETWGKVGKGIVLKEPKGDGGSSIMFLGCEQTLVEKEIKGQTGSWYDVGRHPFDETLCGNVRSGGATMHMHASAHVTASHALPT